MPPTQAAEKKKQQILKAAHAVLIKHGYAATTINQVSAEAGVSRGLLHYYFKNKEEMLAMVLRSGMENTIKLTRSLFASAHSAEDLAAGISSVLRETFRVDPDLFRLFFESGAMARQSPLIAEELRKLYADFREMVARELGGLVERQVIAPVLPLDGISVMLTGIIDAVWFQLVAEPDLCNRPSVWQAAETAVYALLTSTATGKDGNPRKVPYRGCVFVAPAERSKP